MPTKKSEETPKKSTSAEPKKTTTRRTSKTEKDIQQASEMSVNPLADDQAKGEKVQKSRRSKKDYQEIFDNPNQDYAEVF